MSHTVPLLFHLGYATDYEQKAEIYRQKTGAYIDLERIHYGQYLIKLFSC
jgi:hypothetical protein